MKVIALLARVFLAAALLLALAGSVMPARAEVAPPPPPAGANLFPNIETTQVRMMSETVSINVVQTEPGEAPYARVRAQFKMRNLGQAEENLQVRFPLNFLVDYMGDWQTCEYPLAYPEISDFTALVEGEATPVSTTTQQKSDPGGVKGTVDVKCWASFPVTFLPGEDVDIEVRYTIQAAPGLYGMSNNIQFYYVLVSGKDWKDTIGSAEIILSAPYTLTGKTLLGAQPEGGVVKGSEIRWKFENFEPDTNITVGLLDPGHWKLINQQVKAVTANPQDGEAWAKLARAYRDAVISEPDGFHGQSGGFEYYGQSLTAFAKAVGLRPNDADLRIDYAALLIRNAFNPIAGDADDIYHGLVVAVKQLQRALEIHPNHPRAIELLERLESWQNAPVKIVDLSGAQPAYLILTPGGRPTHQFPPSRALPSHLHSPPQLPGRATQRAPPPSHPRRRATVPQSAITLVLPTSSEADAPVRPEAPRSSPSPVCGTALLPLGILAAILSARRIH
jgi:hypothetical protein